MKWYQLMTPYQAARSSSLHPFQCTTLAVPTRIVALSVRGGSSDSEHKPHDIVVIGDGRCPSMSIALLRHSCRGLPGVSSDRLRHCAHCFCRSQLTAFSMSQMAFSPVAGGRNAVARFESGAISGRFRSGEFEEREEDRRVCTRYEEACSSNAWPCRVGHDEDENAVELEGRDEVVEEEEE